MDFKNQQPIYLQIAEHICDEILQGRYSEGERLPSVREYAAEVEVNVNTLVRSYDWLSQKEIIFNRRGLGYFVSEGAAAHIAEVRRQEFFQDRLPEVFQTMKTLGIAIEDVVTEYKIKIMDKMNILIMSILGMTLMTLTSCNEFASKVAEKATDAIFEKMESEQDTSKLGPVVDKTLDLTGFTSIEAVGAVKIVYTQDSTYSVTLHGNEKAVEKYDVYLDDEDLRVELKDNRGQIKRNTPTITVNVSSPCLTGIDCSGAVRTDLKGPIVLDNDLDIEISGAGKLNVESLKCRAFDLDMAGVAKVQVASLECQSDAKVEISGAGESDLNMTCQGDAKLEMSGAGKCRMTVDCQKLSASISGAGKVELDGRVDKLSKHVSGAGKIDADNLKVTGAE